MTNFKTQRETLTDLKQKIEQLTHEAKAKGIAISEFQNKGTTFRDQIEACENWLADNEEKIVGKVEAKHAPAPAANSPAPAQTAPPTKSASALLREYEALPLQARGDFLLTPEVAALVTPILSALFGRESGKFAHPANADQAAALLLHYNKMQGEERSRFYAANSAALFTAAGILEAQPANQDPEANETDGAKLYAQYQSLQGRAKTAFFAKNEAALLAYGATVSND